MPTETRDFAPRTPEIDENDENGGCHPSKMTVCQKHRFDNPEGCRTWRHKIEKTQFSIRHFRAGIPNSQSGPEKGVITKGVFSLEKALESLKSLDSLESLENGRNHLSFPQSGGPLETLESLNSLESLENGLF